MHSAEPLTKPYSPTTTGKVERWHQSLQINHFDEEARLTIHHRSPGRG